jgi:D-alanyl-D-alanine carboxypeptidase
MRLSLAFLLLISLQSSAQIEPALIDQFETAFQEYGDATQIIGMSIAIRTADDVWTDQYGVSAESEPLTEDHIFAMGSVSKTIISATILHMYEEGLLSLEDSLFQYLDTYANIDSTVTIRQLLNHTSGIYNYTNHPNFFTDALIINPQQIIQPEEVLANYVLGNIFTAGTNFSYSNTNYVLLGMIITEIAGQSYYEEARERFDFDTNYPSLSLPPFETSPEDLAHLWANFDGSGASDIQANGLSLNNLFSGAGAAGAFVATPKDLSQWTRDLYSGEILQSSTMVQLFNPSAFNMNYGLGVVLLSGDCSTDLVGHGGNIVYGTINYYDEENDLVVTIQTNDGDTNVDLAQLVFDIFCINADFVLSVNEKKYLESFTVFPNPVTDQFQISLENEWQGELNIQVVNGLGQTVRSTSMEKNETHFSQRMNVAELPAGIYRLLVSDGEEMMVQSFVKK